MLITSSTAGIHLQNIVLDTVATSKQKISCLKLMKVVIKNLLDDEKNKDEKYRQLKLDNQKVRDKILVCASAVDYLKAIGFVEATSNENSAVLRFDNISNLEALSAAMEQINKALEILVAKEEKEAQDKSDAPKRVFMEERLSEKQRARRILEEKECREREEARAQRKRNIALLKQDKFVRENDENWKSGPSAACAKAGSSISTFRDRHGEN